METPAERPPPVTERVRPEWSEGVASAQWAGSLPLDSLGESSIFLEHLGEAVSVSQQLDLLRGTLDMVIVKAISLGPLHGCGILLRIQQISKDRLGIQGSLSPALYRLGHRGSITSEWGESEDNRKAKYYRLIAAGKCKFLTEAEKWNRMADAIAGILLTTPEEV